MKKFLMSHLLGRWWGEKSAQNTEHNTKHNKQNQKYTEYKRKKPQMLYCTVKLEVEDKRQNIPQTVLWSEILWSDYELRDSIVGTIDLFTWCTCACGGAYAYTTHSVWNGTMTWHSEKLLKLLV